MSEIAATPKPPYYAVIFTSELSEDTEGYSDMAEKMVQLAQEQEGFLGFESARESLGLSVSYWKDEASIVAWKKQSEHLQVQKEGRERWYKHFRLRVAKVERDYGV